MEKVIVKVSHSGKNFGAFLPLLDGCVATGSTREEIIKNIIEAVKFHIEGSLEDNDPLPNVFIDGNYELVYQFDTAAVLAIYKGVFTNAAMERITGINQKQIQHYTTGFRKPRPAQAKKIQESLHKLGAELLAIEL